MEGGDFLELVRCRRSLREFDPRPVEREKILTMLEAARLAPSSCNTQPWRIVVVEEKGLIGELSRCAPVGTRVNRWMESAPLVFVLCAAPHAIIHRAAGLVESDCHELDLGIAGEHLCLMATALGLGSCWIGWFSEPSVRRLLSIPRGVRVKALIPVGYPPAGVDLAVSAHPEARRKNLTEIAWINRFEGEGLHDPRLDGAGRPAPPDSDIL